MHLHATIEQKKNHFNAITKCLSEWLSQPRHYFCESDSFFFRFHVKYWTYYYWAKQSFLCHEIMQKRVICWFCFSLEPSFIVWKQYNCLISGAHSAICFTNNIFLCWRLDLIWKQNPELRCSVFGQRVCGGGGGGSEKELWNMLSRPYFDPEWWKRLCQTS